MKLTSSNTESNNNSTINLTSKNKNNLPPEEDDFFSRVANSLKFHNMKKELLRNNSKNHKNIIISLLLVEAQAESHLKYANKNEKKLYKNMITTIKGKVALVERHINLIEEDLDLEISKIQLISNTPINIAACKIEQIKTNQSTSESGDCILNDAENLLRIAKSTISELNKRTKPLKEKWRQINLEKIEPSIFIKHETDYVKKVKYQEKINESDKLLSLIDDDIHSIAKELEIIFFMEINKNSTTNKELQISLI